MKNLLTIIILSFSLTIFAQQPIQLALTLYQNKKYEAAAPIFLKLYKKQRNKFYFNYYLDCLIKTQQYDKAKKLVNREARKHKHDLTYLVDKAYVLKILGKTSDAQKINRKVLQSLPSQPNVIRQVVNEYLRFKEYDNAEAILNKGIKTTGNQFFNLRYILYAISGQTDKMTDVLLAWLGSQPSQFSFIQKTFSNYLNNDVNNEFADMLQKKLLLRIQKTHLPVYYRMYIWLLTEKKQYNLAVIQAIAYDRRINGFGSIVYETAMKALDENQLTAAQQAFQYIIKKGPNSPYYNKARTALLKVMYNKVITGKIYSLEQIKKLEQQYISIINDLPLTNETIDIYAQLAHLEAFYLNNDSQALSYVDKALNYDLISPQLKGKLLIEKAKILVKEHKFYQAILILGQAQDENALNEIGSLASFYQALTYFFLNNFKWAKAQFDILKGQTEKLTANDAIYYSDLIKPAIEDSTKLPILKLYSKALFYEFTHQNDSALVYLDSVINFATYLADIALLDKYKIHIATGNYSLAATDLKQLVNNFTNSLYIDKATYLLGSLYEQNLNQPNKAKEYFKKILFDYRNSIYVPLAREQYNKLIRSQ